MKLYNNTDEDDYSGTSIGRNLYLIPEKIQTSTKSTYAFVKIYDDRALHFYLAEGWISIDSMSFVVDNY